MLLLFLSRSSCRCGVVREISPVLKLKFKLSTTKCQTAPGVEREETVNKETSNKLRSKYALCMSTLYIK